MLGWIRVPQKQVWIRVMLAGALVDCRGEQNRTALIWAADRGDVELMDVLIGVGAGLAPARKAPSNLFTIWVSHSTAIYFFCNYF